LATEENPSEIELMILGIQTYTELTVEAASEETDPEIATELLTDIQVTQADTTELLETTVDDFIFDGSQKIDLKKFKDPTIKAERKLQRKTEQLKKLAEKLAGSNIPKEEAGKIIEKHKEHLENLATNAEAIKADSQLLKTAVESRDKEAVKAGCPRRQRSNGNTRRKKNRQKPRNERTEEGRKEEQPTRESKPK